MKFDTLSSHYSFERTPCCWSTTNLSWSLYGNEYYKFKMWRKQALEAVSKLHSFSYIIWNDSKVMLCFELNGRIEVIQCILYVQTWTFQQSGVFPSMQKSSKIDLQSPWKLTKHIAKLIKIGEPPTNINSKVYCGKITHSLSFVAKHYAKVFAQSNSDGSNFASLKIK